MEVPKALQVDDVAKCMLQAGEWSRLADAMAMDDVVVSQLMGSGEIHHVNDVLYL